jgi:uncharacterized repeat protein (TIGR02543 family)
MGDIGSTVPTRTGYTFRGWSASSSYSSKRIVYLSSNGGGADSNGVSATQTSSSWTYADYCSNTGGSTSSRTLTLYAQWEASTASYTVYHYKQNVDGTYPSSATSTTTGTANIGSSITPSVNSYTGFTSPSTQTITIASSGNTVSYYYTRNSYTLTVKPNGGTWNSTTSNSSYTMLYGATKTIANPTRTGYTFNSWTLSGTNSSMSGTTFTMGTANATLTANWTVNNYTVTYKDVVDSTSGEVLGTSTASKAYGSTVQGSDLGSATSDNAYYNGYYYVSDTSATVTISGATVYRIFKLRTIDISGTIKWKDKDNEYGSRPDSVTVSLLKGDSLVDSVSGLTNNNECSFSFTDLPKYNPLTGDEYIYTVEQSDFVSKNAPEDKYVSEITGSTSSGFIITNTLKNNVTDKDEKENEEPEETGFTVKGSIIWEDNNNNLGYRPENVVINLYMDGELLKSAAKDKNASSYIFTNLERYIYNDNGTVKETHTYQIEEVMNPVPSYVVDGETEEAYTITYSLPKIDTKDGSGIINITNTFNNAESIIPVKPYNNSLTVKTNQEIKTEIILHKMNADYVDNEVVYKDTYSDVYYNLEINNIAETISHMVAGKYEISTTSSLFTIDNVELLDNEYVSFIEDNGKYYVVIEETPNDAYGVITINLTEKEHKGYQAEPDVSDNTDNTLYKVSNYWKTTIEKIDSVNQKSRISRKLIVSDTSEVITYSLEEDILDLESDSEKVI